MTIERPYSPWLLTSYGVLVLAIVGPLLMSLAAVSASWLISTSLLFLVLGVLILRTVHARISRSDAALAEGEARFRQVIEGLHEAVWLSAADSSEVYYLSPAFEALWEIPAERVYRDPGAWLEAVHPSDRERVEQAVPLQSTGEYDEEFRVVMPDGRIKWIRDRAFPVRNREGRVTRVAGIAEDVTQQRDLEREILRTRELRAVARLAAGLAHDFNNQLTVIESHTQLLLGDLGDNPRVRDDLQAIRGAAGACTRLTRKLLAYGRQQVLVPRRVGPLPFLRESVPVLRKLLARSIGLEIEPTGGLPGMTADPAHLREALMNIVAYAGRQLPGGATIRLRARVVEAGSPISVEGQEPLPPGRFVALDVVDSGPGIPAADRERIFEPFPRGVGEAGWSGLELASALGIAQQSGGGIQVVSSPDGTTFTLLVPTAEAAAESRAL